MFDSRHVCLTASFLLLLCSGGMLGSLRMMTHSVRGASHACAAKRHKACPAHQLASWQGNRDVDTLHAHAGKPSVASPLKPLELCKPNASTIFASPMKPPQAPLKPLELCKPHATWPICNANAMPCQRERRGNRHAAHSRLQQPRRTQAPSG